MQVLVSLCDKNNCLILNRKLPLSLKLLYDNELNQEVMKQTNLKVIGGSMTYIDPGSGQAALRFRIEDVSKNHQGQNFKVLISSDCVIFGNVVPACTPSVSVRSKRNKRGRLNRFIESPCDGNSTSNSHPVRSLTNYVSVAKRRSLSDNRFLTEGFQNLNDVRHLREGMSINRTFKALQTTSFI